MRKGKIKRHRRRARIRAAAWRLAAGAYDLAVDVWWLYIGTVYGSADHVADRRGDLEAVRAVDWIRR